MPGGVAGARPMEAAPYADLDPHAQPGRTQQEQGHASVETSHGLRRAQESARSRAQQGPGREARQGNEEKDQRQGEHPALAFCTASREYTDHRQGHRPGLGVDQLQAGGAA